MKYCTIVADPPWHYEGFATMPGNAGKKGHVTKREPPPYGTMTLDEIRALPVGELAEDNALLFLWTTNKYLPDSFSVCDAWGFSYRQTLVWHKTGNPSPFGGTVAPNHAEYLIVAAKGKPKTVGRLKGSVIAAQKPYKHSLKPECFLDYIETVGPGPYLEMFARRKRIGWDSWGDEVESDITIEGDGMGITEQIEAAKAKLAKEQERLAALEKKAAEGPKRTAHRDVTQIREIMLLEENVRKRYGAGFSGLAEIVRKAKKDGIEPVVATGQKLEQPVEPPIPPPIQQHEVTPELRPADAVAARVDAFEPSPPMPVDEVPEAPEFDENDEPPVPNPPEAVAALEEADMPW